MRLLLPSLEPTAVFLVVVVQPFGAYPIMAADICYRVNPCIYLYLLKNPIVPV